MAVTPTSARTPASAAIAAMWRFDLGYFVVAVLLFVALVLLATVGARLGWVRSFLGDVLAVVWVYTCFKAFLAVRTGWLAAAALGIGLMVEAGQYLATVLQLQIPNRALRIVLGSTPDWWDVLAYVLGFLAVVAVERWRRGPAHDA